MRFAIWGAAGALGMSLMAHGSGLMLVPSPSETLAPPAPTGLAKLGNSFADMVSGVTSPPSMVADSPVNDDSAMPTDLSEATPAQIDPAREPSVADVSEAPTPDILPTQAAELETAQDVSNYAPASAVELSSAPSVIEVNAAEVKPVSRSETELTLAANVTPAAEPVPTPITPVQPPVEAPTLDAARPTETITAADETDIDHATPEQTRTPDQPTTADTVTAPASSAASAGAGDADAIAGRADGDAAGLDPFGGPGDDLNASLTEGSDPSSYGNKVLETILNTEKMETSLKGSALVSFAIGESGFLTSVSIRKSSGTLELDELAVDHIRRAAPFPPPPPGARQRFTIEFAGN